MKAEAATITYIKLTLSENEARWLKNIMQNPLYDISPDEEDAQDHIYRERLWNALKCVKSD